MAQQQAIHKFVLGTKELEGKSAEFQYDKGWYSITDIVGEERNVIYKSKTQINFEVSGDNNEDIDKEMYKVYQQSQGERNLFYAAIKSRKYKNLLQSKKFKETLNSFYKLPNNRIIKGKSI